MVESTVQHHRASILNLLPSQHPGPRINQYSCNNPSYSSSIIVTITILCDANSHLLSSKWQTRTHCERHQLYNRTTRSVAQTYRHSLLRYGPIAGRFPIRNWPIPTCYGKHALLIFRPTVGTKYPVRVRPASPRLIHWPGAAKFICCSFWSCLLWHSSLPASFGYTCKFSTNPKSRDRGRRLQDVEALR